MVHAFEISRETPTPEISRTINWQFFILQPLSKAPTGSSSLIVPAMFYQIKHFSRGTIFNGTVFSGVLASPQEKLSANE